MNIRIKLTLLVLFMAFTLATASAQDLSIIREAKNQVTVGEPLDIRISLFNQGTSQKSVIIEERIPENFELLNPPEPTKTKYYNGITVSFLEWELSIPAGRSESVTYTITSQRPGDITIPPTKITDKSTSTILQGEIFQLTVNCEVNAICESGENYLNCPQDCPTGSKDGICDSMADEICDPDCTKDPDCTILNKINLKRTIFIILAAVIILITIRITKRKIKESRYLK
ncbi:MAG: BatD family protein [Nanoarchaeota archaeon]|nr:BatD family protein [Nanoarchaeota archaeon]